MIAKYAIAGLAGTALLASVAFAQSPSAPSDTTKNAPTTTMSDTSSSFQGNWRASKLVGLSVYNEKNESVGSINDMLTDKNGKIVAVVIGVGGFLGVGEREVLLGWRDLQIESNGEVVRVNMTKDQLKAMAPYSYKDPAYRGTVFTDKGVYVPDRANTDRTATASAPTRSTGDFNVAGQMSAEALIGKTVKNATNESVGKIDDVYLDASGAVKLVVVSVGGFLGVGTKNVAVPWTDLKFGRDGSSITVLTNWTKDSLKAMPDYKDERRIPAGTVRSGG